MNICTLGYICSPYLLTEQGMRDMARGYDKKNMLRLGVDIFLFLWDFNKTELSVHPVAKLSKCHHVV